MCEHFSTANKLKSNVQIRCVLRKTFKMFISIDAFILAEDYFFSSFCLTYCDITLKIKFIFFINLLIPLQ